MRDGGKLAAQARLIIQRSLFVPRAVMPLGGQLGGRVGEWVGVRPDEEGEQANVRKRAAEELFHLCKKSMSDK